MKVLYGTTNPAKLESMRRITKTLDLEIIGLGDLGLPIPEVDESGKDPLENAIIKAKKYYEAFSMPVFSCDSGLYFDDLEDTLQPGTHIRRVDGKELTDDEMIAHYAELAETQGGRLIGRYRNGVCFIVDEEHIFPSMEEALSTEPFALVSVPHEIRIPGYPLDSLSVDIATGRYYHDMEGASVDKSAIEQGYQAYFGRVLSMLQEQGALY